MPEKKNLCTMTAKEIKTQTVSCKQDPLRAAGIFLNFLLLLSAQNTSEEKLKPSASLCGINYRKSIWPSRSTLRKQSLSLRALKKE